MKRKKICFVVSTLSTVNAFLRDHIALLSKDYDIYIVSNENKNFKKILQNLDVKDFKDIDIVRKISVFRDILAVFSLFMYFKKEQFDIVHSITPKAGLVSVLAGFLARINHRVHIFTGQVWYGSTGFKKNLLIFIDKLIARIATDILVDGNSQRSFLISKGIILESNSQVLGLGSISGVNTHRFFPDSLIREKYRNELNISDDKIVFVFLGRMNRDKGIKDLFDAFSELVKYSSDAYLLLIGSDEEGWTEKIKKYSSLIEKENYSYYGFTSKPEHILQAADVFCLPSYREGFGTSVIEAACLGLPVICSDTYGLKDTMIDNVTGLRHKVRNSGSLYEQMKFITDERELRIQMGIAGRQYVLDNFKSENISNSWLEFYQSLLEKKI